MDIYTEIYEAFMMALRYFVEKEGYGGRSFLAAKANISSALMTQILHKTKPKPVGKKLQGQLANACGHELDDFIELGRKLLSEGKTETITPDKKQQNHDLIEKNKSVSKISEDNLFPERLAILIKEKARVSQAEFCKKTGITTSYLSMILSGKRGPSADLISGVYIHYREFFDWLISGVDSDESMDLCADPIVQEHVGIVKKFSHKEQVKKINEHLLAIDKQYPENLKEVEWILQGMAAGLKFKFEVVNNSLLSGQSGDNRGKFKNGTED
ncbi:helix-turn-helix domain-containing protein [Desulforegula conservatrix]|uniref:helix-turn-helix domain-containing protein n=1 Tax=Desulforegula conservatrix TaxID=153026 RepID=UPI0003FC6920|nr:helix-turn-helix transcriptional regulator [Desulforegula conservatrix]